MRYIKAIVLLAPTMLLCAAAVWCSQVSPLMRKIMEFEFIIFVGIFSAVFQLIVLYLAYNWMKAGLFLLFKIDLRLKKSDSNVGEQ
jgi:hypothetical protein